MKTLFISDLHLSEQAPSMVQLFLDFLENEACRAKALYILGDFFDLWIGDDDLSDFHLRIIQALKQFTKLNVPLYMLTGNRDFLLGKQFFDITGVKAIEDETVIDLYGTPTLLMHGDTLCTQDKSYLRYRKIVHSKLFNCLFLSLPLNVRRKLAKKARKKSQIYTSTTASNIMDVTQSEVTRVMQKHQVTQLIHGHTHRPAVHDVDFGHQKAARIVLGAWHHAGSVLVCEPSRKPELVTL